MKDREVTVEKQAELLRQKTEAVEKIRVDLEAELNRRLDKKIIEMDKKCKSHYESLEYSLQNKYQKRSKQLWTFMSMLMVSAIIPIIGLIFISPNNLNDLIGFFMSFVGAAKGIYFGLGVMWAGIVVNIFIWAVLSALIVLIYIYWFSEHKELKIPSMCVSIAIGEILIAINASLPSSITFNPFWIWFVLAIIVRAIMSLIKRFSM